MAERARRLPGGGGLSLESFSSSMSGSSVLVMVGNKEMFPPCAPSRTCSGMFPNPVVNYEDGPQQVPMANPTEAYRRSLERVTRLLQRFVDCV